MFISVSVCVLRKRRQNAVNNNCFFGRKNKIRKHVASKKISFAVKNSFECMIFMFYLMLLRVNQDDNLTFLVLIGLKEK